MDSKMQIPIPNNLPISEKGEIVLYKADDEVNIEVIVMDESVWLTQNQMAELFQKDRTVIGRHINNIYKEQELERTATCAFFAQVQKEGDRMVQRQVPFYTLDMIISVGYRVNSKRGTQFRQWASRILKEYLLKGYSINHRFNELEDRVDRRIARTEWSIEQLNNKMDFYIQSSLPRQQGIFFDGQVFDAYEFVSGLIRRARQRIVLIDNYVDESVLMLLSKRESGVKATLCTASIGKQLRQDLAKHNEQYPAIEVVIFGQSHDRFLCIDDEVYLIGASLKDLGKKWFGFSLLHDITTADLLSRIATP